MDNLPNLPPVSNWNYEDTTTYISNLNLQNSIPNIIDNHMISHYQSTQNLLNSSKQSLPSSLLLPSYADSGCLSLNDETSMINVNHSTSTPVHIVDNDSTTPTSHISTTTISPINIDSLDNMMNETQIIVVSPNNNQTNSITIKDHSKITTTVNPSTITVNTNTTCTNTNNDQLIEQKPLRIVNYSEENQTPLIKQSMDEYKRNLNMLNLSSNMVKNKQTDEIHQDESHSDSELNLSTESINRKNRAEVKIQPYALRGNIEVFRCPLCSKDEIFSRGHLTNHLQDHQSNFKREDYKHVCCFCFSELSSNSSLERHLLTHTNHRPFNCNLCDKAFTTNGNLSRHIRTSHQAKATTIVLIYKNHRVKSSDLNNHGIDSSKMLKSHSGNDVCMSKMNLLQSTSNNNKQSNMNTGSCINNLQNTPSYLNKTLQMEPIKFTSINSEEYQTDYSPNNLMDRSTNYIKHEQQNKDENLNKFTEIESWSSYKPNTTLTLLQMFSNYWLQLSKNGILNSSSHTNLDSRTVIASLLPSFLFRNSTINSTFESNDTSSSVKNNEYVVNENFSHCLSTNSESPRIIIREIPPLITNDMEEKLDCKFYKTYDFNPTDYVISSSPNTNLVNDRFPLKPSKYVNKTNRNIKRKSRITKLCSTNKSYGLKQDELAENQFSPYRSQILQNQHILSNTDYVCSPNNLSNASGRHSPIQCSYNDNYLTDVTELNYTQSLESNSDEVLDLSLHNRKQGNLEGSYTPSHEVQTLSRTNIPRIKNFDVTLKPPVFTPINTSDTFCSSYTTPNILAQSEADIKLPNQELNFNSILHNIYHLPIMQHMKTLPTSINNEYNRGTTTGTTISNNNPLNILSLPANTLNNGKIFPVHSTIPTTLIQKKNSYKDAPKLITCPIAGCQQKFPWNSSLKRHILTHTPHKPFACTRCTKSFSTKSNRERHMERVHRVKKQHETNKNLLESKDPINYSLKTTTYDMRYVSCCVCLHRFGSQQDLQRHMRSHTGERPFVCPHCGKEFSLKHSMHRHARVHIKESARTNTSKNVLLSTSNHSCTTFKSEEIS
ncbi:putative zinc finger protein [Schistosoma mansoni]|uniref:putative zinc finger protein n=1 Tax=Schistosoma mansoni TaxID=6183 RepID=UPI00022DC157|nr:putative zinc finger protein [Schistosoma mansoni]|eukprot:XP_018649310.1 putative zinc finger protein [Schistosoma mansoni]